jgi:hypothetical protein
VCVMAYYAVGAASLLFGWLFIQDTFLQTKPGAPAAGTPALRVRMMLPRYNTTVKLRVSGEGRCDLVLSLDLLTTDFKCDV